MQLADVGVKCPQCGIRFNSRIPPTVYDSGRRDSELRVIPRRGEEHFEPYVICTCPSCGKSDWAQDFAPSLEMCALNSPNLAPHLQYRTAAVEGERAGMPWYQIAIYYMYAAWCADDILAAPQAREYRRLASAALRKSLQDESCPAAERQTVEYLIGELLRRSGAFVECIEHFKETIARLPEHHAFMARKLMRLADAGKTDAIPYDSAGI